MRSVWVGAVLLLIVTAGTPRAVHARASHSGRSDPVQTSEVGNTGRGDRERRRDGEWRQGPCGSGVVPVRR